jgi:hypothetical protein
MAQNQNQQPQKEFDVHDTNDVLTKFAQIRQTVRQLDDDITGLIYIAVNQLQKEQKDAREKAAEVQKRINEENKGKEKVNEKPKESTVRRQP